uniref:AP-4 complex subunit mu-1 n=2 Tax=Parasteatoda tepidariorum TaxID=114398 RepID=A0A2L2YFM1_PARTP
MMLSHLLIFSSRGDILIEEKYRYDIPEHDLRSLINIVLKQKPSQYSPYFKFNNINGYAIKNEKVTYLAVSKKELPTIIILQFLENFHSLIRNFCGGASEDYINRNLLLVYELMTECVDNGVIKATSTEQVHHSVYSDPVFTKISFKSEVKKPGPFGLEKKFIPNLAAERPLVKSRSELMNLKNEVFVDVIEKIVVHLSKEGIIQKYKLHGVILMKSFLPLSHKIIVNLEDNLKQGDVMKALIFEQHHFSSCVDDKNFEKHRSFVVTPSQGEVKAMTYYSTTSASFVPFRLLSIVEDVDKNRDCDLTLQLSCNLPSNVEALNVVLHIPVPSTTRK